MWGINLLLLSAFIQKGWKKNCIGRYKKEKNSSLSSSEYVKKVLSEYFVKEEIQRQTEDVLLEIREEYHKMLEGVEEAVYRSIQKYDFILAGARENSSGEERQSGDTSRIEQERLPEESSDIPEGAIDFLNSFD